MCDSCDRAQKRKANPMLPRRRTDEEIFQVNPTLAQPGGIVVEEESEADRLIPQIRDQNFGRRPLSKQGLGEILLGNRRFSRLRPLVFGKLEDELAYERDVFFLRLHYASVT